MNVGHIAGTIERAGWFMLVAALVIFGIDAETALASAPAEPACTLCFYGPDNMAFDKAGNIWTVDAGNSMVYEFTPAGKKLMEISIGEQPERKTGFVILTNGDNGYRTIFDDLLKPLLDDFVFF